MQSRSVRRTGRALESPDQSTPAEAVRTGGPGVVRGRGEAQPAPETYNPDRPAPIVRKGIRDRELCPATGKRVRGGYGKKGGDLGDLGDLDRHFGSRRPRAVRDSPAPTPRSTPGNRAWPCGSMKPNDVGPFDVLGIASEGCCGEFDPDPPTPGRAVEGQPISILLSSER